jgi:hypothetical protein
MHKYFTTNFIIMRRIREIHVSKLYKICCTPKPRQRNVVQKVSGFFIQSPC